MGQAYSEPTLKVKLKMGIQRCNMVVNKKNNAIKVARKELATLLSKGKAESARIKVEGVVGEMNMVRVLEILALMLELLLQRIMLISSSREPPEDLLESMATIIYCAKRVDIPELAEVATQLQLKYGAIMGPEWAKQHLVNAHKKVSPKVIERLAITPPSFDAVITFLKEIAEQYELEWEPSFEKCAEDDSPDKIGAIAPIHPEEDTGEDEAKMGASFETKGSEYPGTINIIVHQCKELTSDKPSEQINAYVQLCLDGLTPILKTSVDFTGDKAPKWEEEHFPFSLKGIGYQLKVEIFASHSPKDKLIGSALLSVDGLISAQKRSWYPLSRDKGAKAGQIEISTQYLPLRVAPHPSYVRGGFALPSVPTTDPGFSASGGGSGSPGGTLVAGPPMVAGGTTVMMGGPPMPMMSGGTMMMGPSGPVMVQTGGPMMMTSGPMMVGSGPMMMGPPMMMVPGGTHPMMMPMPGTQGPFPGQYGPTGVPVSGGVPDGSSSVSSMSSSSSSSSSSTALSSSSLASTSSTTLSPALSTSVSRSSTSDPSASERKSTKVVAPEPAEDEDGDGEGGDDGDGVPGFDELEKRFRALKGIS